MVVTMSTHAVDTKIRSPNSNRPESVIPLHETHAVSRASSMGSPYERLRRDGIVLCGGRCQAHGVATLRRTLSMYTNERGGGIGQRVITMSSDAE